MKKHFIIYKITNTLLNNKVYIGAHETYNIEDGYMGSGLHIKNAQSKYGLNNFTKEILFVFDSRTEMYEKEAEIVNTNFIKSKRTYNITLGGCGGFYHLNNNKDEMKERNSKAGKIWAEKTRKQNPEYFTDFQRIGCKAALEKYPNGTPNSFNNNKELHLKAIELSLSDEARHKRKETLKSINHQQGSKNSQFGTCWIYSNHLKENKKVNKDDLDNWLSLGWIKGRKINF